MIAVRGLDHPAQLLRARHTGAPQHLDKLTHQRMMGMDYPPMPQSRDIFRGIVLLLLRCGTTIPPDTRCLSTLSG